MFPRANLSETFGILFNLFTEAERLKSVNCFFIAIKRNWFLCGRPGHKYLCPSLPSTQHQIEQKDVSRTSFDICRDHLDSLWGCGDQAILIWKFHSQPALNSLRYEIWAWYEMWMMFQCHWLSERKSQNVKVSVSAGVEDTEFALSLRWVQN